MAQVSVGLADKTGTMDKKRHDEADDECDKCVERGYICEHGFCFGCCGCSGEPDFIFEGYDR